MQMVLLMDFKKAARFGTFISKDYAESIFRLLVNYHDVSASEAASRLGLHIRTVQDFLESMADFGILDRKEVVEKKRPYNRYRLLQHTIEFNLDLLNLAEVPSSDQKVFRKIRERKNAGVRFTTARYDQWISNVVIWVGRDRERKERRINLTIPQGKFLFHLPFPNAQPASIQDIMKKAGVGQENVSEITDIVDLLLDYQVIEEA
jgi:hypothetical protein